ncbi:MAG: cell division protein FtsA [Candidatus Moraniibacteriota bacterium]
MGRKQYCVGLDIGTALVRSVIAQSMGDGEPLRVLGVGTAESVGLRRGVVVNADEVAKSVNRALETAERQAGVAAEDVLVSVSGADIFCQEAIGVVAVGKADGEVTEDDLIRVVEETQARTMLSANREILHVVPQHYRLDDQTDIKDPVGMRGVRLELSALVVGTAGHHLKNLGRSLELAGVTPRQFVVEPLASAEAVLLPKQKDLGVVLVNIGGSTTSVAVFEDGDLLHLAVLPVGGGHITNDIAIGLRASIDVAEAVKLQYGHALPDEIGKKEEVDLGEFDSQETDAVSRRHVAEIIEARIEEIFQYVNNELKSIHREALLPAGAVLTGGGVLLPGVVELAKKHLRLPAQIGYPKPLGGILDQVDSPAFATVVGLLLLSQEERGGGHGSRMGKVFESVPDGMKDLAGKMRQIFRRFLP